MSNSYRALQVIGWRHAEPVLRSLAYALLAHEGGNPADRDAAADRPGRLNLPRTREFRHGWQHGKLDPAATDALATIFRTESAEAAGAEVVKTLNRGVDPQSVWDAIFAVTGELLMRRPGIVALHAATSSNALRYAFDHCGDDQTRRFLLLQNAAFLPLFRGNGLGPAATSLEPESATETDPRPDDALTEIFAAIDSDKRAAARKTFAYLRSGKDPEDFIRTARRYLFLKGSNSHDYKFSSAVLEDYGKLSPVTREHFLASSVFNLRGSTGRDNALVDRIRAALA